MEFTEAAKAKAVSFLEQFTSKHSPPGPDEQVPVRPAWPHLEESEVEAECLDMARSYLAKNGCPGILSYHLSSESCKRLKANSLDRFKCPPEAAACVEATPTNDDVEPTTGTTTQKIDSILLSRGLLSVLHQVCSDWAKQLPSLAAPTDKIELSLHGIKNTRRKMEDRYSLCVDVNSLYGLKDLPPQSFYAVFDGHVGVEAASYASTHLLTNIVRHAAFRDDVVTAMKEAFKLTDENFCKKGARSGTTAIVTLIRGQKLYVGWLGDSQATLVRKGEPLNLNDPHKPGREDEQQRIEEAGGLIVWMGGAWRVNGNLSVSRAIGDAKDKKFVVGDADISTFDLDGSEDYLVVACDGVWDVLSGEEMEECVTKHLATGQGSRQTVAKAIIDCAKSEGSADNMTVIVVYFNGFVSDTPTKESCDTTCNHEGTPPN